MCLRVASEVTLLEIPSCQTPMCGVAYSCSYVLLLQHVGFCEHRQSRAVLNMLKKSHRLTSSRRADSIGNQTVEIGVRVRVSKSRFWCRFWSRSCVISVSTDSWKKSWKRKADRRRLRRLHRLSLCAAWWKSFESVGPVYGRCTGKRRVRFCSWICLLQTCVRHADTVTTAKTHDVGESDFFSSAAWTWSLQHTDNRNARLWMVSWQEKKKKKKRARRNGRKLPIHGLECLVLAWPGTTVERWPEKEKLWQSTRGE